QQGRLAAPAGPDHGDDLARLRVQRHPGEGRDLTPPRAKRPAHDLDPDSVWAVKIARLLRGSLDHCASRSLRGHYPTGSKGQRRVAVAWGAISAGFPASPPGFSLRAEC